jgi:ATP-dependent DNA helicase RecQ
LGQPTVLALTATATKKVIHDIVTSLTLGEVNYHLYSIDRPNISIHVDQLETIEDKKMKLLEWVGKLQGPGIIYFSSRYWTEHICELLKSSGIEGVAYYHGGMETDQRLLIQQQFLNDQLQLICCTNAFGMGVNKPNVRYVIHFHYPSHMEGYLQEIGRAGRDGEKSIAVLLHSRSDQELPQALIMQEYPTRDELEHLFRLLNETLNKNFYISEEWLLSHTTLTETKWRFIKYQLEQKGLLKENKLIGLLDSGEVVVGIETFIEERLAYKQGKLNEMRNWIMTSSCRRQAYLAVFNETLEAPLEQCCDNCSIDYNMYNKDLEFKKLPPIKGWQQELQAILLSRRDYEKSGGAY